MELKDVSKDDEPTVTAILMSRHQGFWLFRLDGEQEDLDALKAKNPGVRDLPLNSCIVVWLPR